MAAALKTAHCQQKTHHQVHAVLLNILMRRRRNAGVVRVRLLALGHARVTQLLRRGQQALQLARQRSVVRQQRSKGLQQEALRSRPVEVLCPAICTARGFCLGLAPFRSVMLDYPG